MSSSSAANANANDAKPSSSAASEKEKKNQLEETQVETFNSQIRMEEVFEHFHEWLTNECLDTKEETAKEAKYSASQTAIANDAGCHASSVNATTDELTGIRLISLLIA